MSNQPNANGKPKDCDVIKTAKSQIEKAALEREIKDREKAVKTQQTIKK